MNPIAVISRVEARGIARRRWSLAVMVIGAAIIIAGAVVAAGRGGLAAEDTMRSWTAAVYLVAGLVLAATLGASTINRDADGGWVGMQVVTGTPRVTVVLGRIAGRLLILVAVSSSGSPSPRSARRPSARAATARCSCTASRCSRT